MLTISNYTIIACHVTRTFSPNDSPTVVDDIREWISSNRLRLNSSKTEVIWLGSRQRVKALESGRMKISGVEIQTSGHIRNLGVIMDASLTFSDHVSKLVRTSYYHFRQLRGIRRSLTTDSCHSLVRALIHSRIDYCNGLMSGVSLQLLDQLDGVMRAAARLVLQLPRTSSITSAIRQRLHWLDVSCRIRFKLWRACLSLFARHGPSVSV